MRKKGQRLVRFLALIPIVDPIVNQINNTYHISIGPFSLLQILRGTLLIIVLVLALTVTGQGNTASRTIRRVALTVGICLAVFAIKETIVRGELVLNTIIAYTQIAYWLLTWYLAAVLIAEPKSGFTLIKGLVIGAIITAASVYLGYMIGVDTTVYEKQGVTASSGWFISPKGIAGTLVSGALLAAYLGHHSRKWPFMLIALLCLGASFLTYARAGMVALGAMIGWLCVCVIRMRSKEQFSWAWRLLLTILCGAAVLVSTVGTEDLVRRWSDVEGPAAGSGRLYLWSAAAQSFFDGTMPEQFLGHGFADMFELMDAGAANSIHTHSDLFDMLVVGGLLGLLALGVILAGATFQIRGASRRSVEFAVAVGILLVWLCQAFFTGQVFLPDVMAYYILGITGVLACTEQKSVSGMRNLARGRAREVLHA